MTTCYNPSLSEEPRNQPIKVTLPATQETLLSWLESSGRFHSNEVDDFQPHKVTEDLDDILEADGYVLEEEEEEEEDLD